MKTQAPTELNQYTASPTWYRFRGSAMILIGGIIALLSIFAPNVYMLGEANTSWVPVIGVIVILVGILRCFDGKHSETAQGFLFNVQGGILDIVVGSIVLFNPNGDVNNVNLLIVGYMLTQGIYRNVLISVAEIANPMSNRITGAVSILLGIMIWIDWPTSIWFIAFSLSVDICFRGWALIVMSKSLKRTRHFD